MTGTATEATTGAAVMSTEATTGVTAMLTEATTGAAAMLTEATTASKATAGDYRPENHIGPSAAISRRRPP